MDESKNKRQAIIDVTARLVVERGVENTSLADIANEADISKGTLYYYYSSKSDLIFDIAEQHIDRVTAYLTAWFDQAAQELTPEEMLRNVLEALLGAELRGKLHLYLIQQAIANDPTLQERFQAKYASWKEMLEERLSVILDNGESQSALASILIALIDGLLIQSVLGIEEIDLEAITRQLSKLANP
ncbi:MAG TPA: TetR/AcrR family transcriptional regulator [Chloroflexi bacterium]|nr:TetR/AcrR family transcriptional regulator [Chloroflexota bacterium]